MSFFDEVDEQPPTTPRTQPRRSRPSGGGRRPPGGQQSIQTRRWSPRSCCGRRDPGRARGPQLPGEPAQQRPEELREQRLVTDHRLQQHRHAAVQDPLQRRQLGQRHERLQQHHSNAVAGAQTARDRARLQRAGPGQDGQPELLLALQMRVDGLTNIAKQIQPALGTSTSKDAVNAIAAEMARLYASDVLYKDYAAKQIAAALHGAGIAVGAPNGQSIAGGQFVPDVSWVTPTFVATAARDAPAIQQQWQWQVRPRPPRPHPQLGQRRRHHAADRLAEPDRRQPGPDVHAQLHQRRALQRDQRRLQGDRLRHQRRRPDDRARDDRRPDDDLHGAASSRSRRPGPTRSRRRSSRSRARRTSPTTRCRTRSRSSSARRSPTRTQRLRPAGNGSAAARLQARLPSAGAAPARRRGFGPQARAPARRLSFHRCMT